MGLLDSVKLGKENLACKERMRLKLHELAYLARNTRAWQNAWPAHLR